ncbi:MAG: polysaccharide ABC transporter ATP-binding protein, partial [Flavobacterium sp.]|uniref:ABC transporter ATP-binding protein n=1 Tax=Flavobacterium sp. TaxID=239 RepID=UPI003BE102CD
QGDSVGIIGRNGAGKSTLLKLLSKVTKPTTGGFKVKGRIASLLEVGTGFNPEMTGRENIYLNGAILGMRRSEITKKLDEIINFSGVERYIDTPVKRYSSGMYVRLAFAVAAHLESEILIVDEVLAVGDAEFQKKCLGKMNDVSKGEGRTVLFVSHNMAAVQNLCFKGILLENGIIKKTGVINDVLAEYLVSTKIENVKLSENTNRKGNGFLKFTDGFFISDNDNNIETFKDLKIKLNFELNFPSKIMQSRIDIGINNFMGDRVAWLSSNVVISEFSIFSNSIEFLIKDLPLAPGDYTLNIYSEINNEIADWLTEVMPFTIIEKDYYKTGKLTLKNQGNILLNFYAK